MFPADADGFLNRLLRSSLPFLSSALHNFSIVKNPQALRRTPMKNCSPLLHFCECFPQSSLRTFLRTKMMMHRPIIRNTTQTLSSPYPPPKRGSVCKVRIDESPCRLFLLFYSCFRAMGADAPCGFGLSSGFFSSLFLRIRVRAGGVEIQLPFGSAILPRLPPERGLASPDPLRASGDSPRPFLMGSSGAEVR